jgi:hypothetical protein
MGFLSSFFYKGKAIRRTLLVPCLVYIFCYRLKINFLLERGGVIILFREKDLIL